MADDESSSRAPFVTLIGAPTDAHSSFLRGAAGAPPLIRKALHSPSSNLAAENGRELGGDVALLDIGDLELDGGAGDFARLRDAAAGARGMALTLGGDHSITFPLVQGLADIHGPLHILHFDAHPDLYDDFEGDPFSHASPFARIMEAGLAARLVQVGIRTLNTHQRAQATRFGVEIIGCDEYDPARVPIPPAPLYVSIDLDVFDPAFCPGVSHYEPGGLSVRDVLTVLHRIETRIVGADIVEYNPLRDVGERTAYVAAKLIKELAALA